VDSALAAAPVPRPPQPTSAKRIVLSSPAWTEGMATPARAEAAATWPVVLRKSRRDGPGFGSVMSLSPWEGGGISVEDPSGGKVAGTQAAARNDDPPGDRDSTAGPGRP